MTEPKSSKEVQDYFETKGFKPKDKKVIKHLSIIKIINSK